MSGFDQLREEINGFQKARAELFKWKFVLVGTALAGGLGFSERAPIGSAWVLLLVPGLALYCDLQILDHDNRIAIIAAFLRSLKNAGIHAAYEEFVAQREFAGAWVLGRAALWGSTILVSLFVIAYGLYLATVPSHSTLPVTLQTVVERWWALSAAGLLWLIAAVTMALFWKSQHERIRSTEPNEVVFERLRRPRRRLAPQ